MREGTVHIVDDDQAVLDSVAFLLRAAGFPVSTHARPDRFIAALDGSHRGCVLLDVQMPGTGGMDVVERLRSLAPSLSVVLMTGSIETLPSASSLGVFAVLEKPVNGERLIECVEGALRGVAGSMPRSDRRSVGRVD
jgi:two-component system response regulator FixJ